MLSAVPRYEDDSLPVVREVTGLEMTEEVNSRSACSIADRANSSRRKEWILVTPGHSSSPFSLSSVHLHNEASLLEIVDALSYVMVPLASVQISQVLMAILSD